MLILVKATLSITQGARWSGGLAQKEDSNALTVVFVKVGTKTEFKKRYHVTKNKHILLPKTIQILF